MSTDKGGRDSRSTSRDAAAPESTSAGATSQYQQLQQQQEHQQQTQQPFHHPHSSDPLSTQPPLHQSGQETQPTLATTATVSSSSQDEPDQDPASPQPQQPQETTTTEKPRQVIAVSASKGPAAFFNLARKFLVTDDMCDLSALEGAIVSAVDAAHLLERSQLATIVRIQTSYVTVEPKRRKQAPLTPAGGVPALGTEELPPPGTLGGAYPVAAPGTSPQQYGAAPQPSSFHTGHHHQPLHPPPRPAGPRGPPAHGGRELRRARIVITVQRTESYKQWLAENPLQAIIAGDRDDDDDDDNEDEADGDEVDEEHVRRKTS